MAANAHRLAVGRAAWWIAKPPPGFVASPPPKPAGSEAKMSFAAALKDLLANLSFHCYGKLVEPGRSLLERFFWIICHINALIALFAFVWATYKDATDELGTTLYNPLYPVCKVPLPAITICSQNRISNHAAQLYAHELSAKDPMRRNASFFYHELRAFGMFYNADDVNDYDRVLRLQGFLDSLDTEPYELFFNTKKRLRLLSPKCSEMLVACRLAGVPFDCQQVFTETLSAYGFCCTFNFEDRLSKSRSSSERFFGQDMGLVLTLYSPTSDNFYRTFKRDGFSIFIYEAKNYPDPQSGAVTTRYVSSGRNSYLPVRPTILETVPEARRLRPEVRNCRYSDEPPYNFTDHYTFSKCISACRARSIFSLCECLPFYLPPEFTGHTTEQVFCTLQHMECLRRYKFKWLNVITSRAYLPGLEQELQDGLYCPECLPSCSEVRYTVRGAGALSFNMPFATNSNGNNNGGAQRMPNSDAANNSTGRDSSELAIVRIYFAETHIQYFRQIIKNDWYEIFSTIGNICGIIAGFSLIGNCELLFFLAKQLWHAFKAELKSELCSRARARTRTQTRSRTRARANGRAKATYQQQRPMELLILP